MRKIRKITLNEEEIKEAILGYWTLNCPPESPQQWNFYSKEGKTNTEIFNLSVNLEVEEE